MGSAAEAAAETPDLPEVDIVARARDGDREAFGILVQRYQARAYRLALRVVRDEELARDVVQDAFLKVYASLDRFEGRSRFYTWLYRVVMNLCLDRKRRDRTHRQDEWSDERAAEAAPSPAAPEADPGPEAQAGSNELQQLVRRAIAELPEEARRTLELREIDGLSYAEIAAGLGIPKGTVMSRLHYARRRLRTVLEELGGEDLAAALGATKDAEGPA